MHKEPQGPRSPGLATSNIFFTTLVEQTSSSSTTKQVSPFGLKSSSVPVDPESSNQRDCEADAGD